MYLVDTNIFLEVMLSRARKRECANFLKLLAEGKESGAVTDFSIHSIIVIMGNLGKKNELKTFLSSLAGYKGLSIYSTSLKDEINAVDISLDNGLDLDDAIQYSAALSMESKGIVSLDRHFDGLEIPRVAPK